MGEGCALHRQVLLSAEAPCHGPPAYALDVLLGSLGLSHRSLASARILLSVTSTPKSPHAPGAEASDLLKSCA